VRGVDADGHGAVLVDGGFDRCDVARGDVDVARDLGQHLRLVVVAQAILRHPGRDTHTVSSGAPRSPRWDPAHRACPRAALLRCRE